MVIDSNDHRPEFSRPVYSVDISENVPVDTIVITLHASDRDEDSKVLFGIHGVRTPASFDTFRLDSLTGAITLAKQLDRYVHSPFVIRYLLCSSRLSMSLINTGTYRLRLLVAPTEMRVEE